MNYCAPLIRWAKGYLILGLIVYLLSISIGSLNLMHLPKPMTTMDTPLLLQSGLTTATEANVKVVVWFEQSPIPDVILKDLPYHQGWNWTQSQLATGNGKEAVTLAGQKLLRKDEEAELFNWFAKVSRLVNQSGGQIYLDERVAEGLDIAAFMARRGTEPLQWSLSGNTKSIAGYQALDSLPTVQAGRDRVNVQLLSRFNHGTGQTVLAIPAILEEF